MMRILTIDDSKVIHAVLTGILEPTYAVLTHAYDGLEGVEVLQKKGEGEFDLVLLDWEMPKLTGIETLERIRKSGMKIPVVMLTTKNAPEDIARALGAGANEYIMKPFVSEILLAKLNDVLVRAA